MTNKKYYSIIKHAEAECWKTFLIKNRILTELQKVRFQTTLTCLRRVRMQRLWPVIQSPIITENSLTTM